MTSPRRRWPACWSWQCAQARSSWPRRRWKKTFSASKNGAAGELVVLEPLVLWRQVGLARASPLDAVLDWLFRAERPHTDTRHSKSQDDREPRRLMLYGTSPGLLPKPIPR